MADFEPGTRVVVKEMPTLLGVGKVIETPAYSQERLTWAKFKGGTEAAFEPGELQLLKDYIDTHHAPDPIFSQVINSTAFENVRPKSKYAHFAGSTNCGPDCCEAR